MSTLNHFSKGFIQAVARSKQKAKQPVQHAVQSKPAQQAQMVNDNSRNVVAATTKLLSDEQYKVSIITLALAHFKKKWSNA